MKNWRRLIPSENTTVLVLGVAILLMLPFALHPTEIQYERNCKYFQSELTALRECATLPGCKVSSEEFTYAATRKEKWCRE